MDKKDEVEIKDEIRTMARSIMPKRKKHRAEYQMTLGSLIKALSKERTGLPVYVEFPSIVFGSPSHPHSYYGYHTDLAFVPQIEEVTVAQFLEVWLAFRLQQVSRLHTKLRSSQSQEVHHCAVSQLLSVVPLGL